MVSHFKHPEKMTDVDDKLLDFIVTTVPTFVMQMIGWSFMIFIYMWLYNRYGIERVIILLLINIVFAIGFVRKAITM